MEENKIKKKRKVRFTSMSYPECHCTTCISDKELGLGDHCSFQGDCYACCNNECPEHGL